MSNTVTSRISVLIGALGLAIIAGCSTDQPTQPAASRSVALSAGVSPDVAQRVANIDPRYLSGAAYRYFYGHGASIASAGSDFFSPQVSKSFTDVIVNNRALTPGIGQSETALAVNARNLVAGWNDAKGFSVFNEGLTGWGVSTDGGRTWFDGGGLPRQATVNFEHIGDPGLVASSAGTFFFSDLCIDGAISGGCMTTGAVAGGTVGWGTPVYAVSTAVNFIDKNFSAVSSSGTDVYMSYTNFINGGGNGQIEVVASHNGGVTWGAPVVLAAAGGTVNQGSMPAIGPGGELYVVWEQGWLNTLTPSIKLRKSTDGGLTFGATINVATIQSIAFSPPVGYNRTTTNDFPRIAVATAGTGTGNVYVTFHSGTASNCDAFIARSTDGGATFGAGVKLNDDATTSLQFFPSIAVDANGVVSATWYDRRLNPGTALTDTYWTASTDGGLTYLPNVRVSTVSTNWSATATDIIPNFGDYNSTAASPNFTFAVWGDGRMGDPDVFYARVGNK